MATIKLYVVFSSCKTQIKGISINEIFIPHILYN